ncbi:MAG: hypothetical protein JO307_18440 [Bryobacterales bacterium]|nr:hypothetical protein [Bryobacterales bacterium]
METVAGELLELQIKTLDRRTERIETNVNSILLQIAGTSKSLTEADRIDSSYGAQLGAHQRAIDDVYRQIAN